MYLIKAGHRGMMGWQGGPQPAAVFICLRKNIYAFVSDCRKSLLHLWCKLGGGVPVVNDLPAYTRVCK